MATAALENQPRQFLLSTETATAIGQTHLKFRMKIRYTGYWMSLFAKTSVAFEDTVGESNLIVILRNLKKEN